MYTLVKRLVATHPAAIAEVALFCREKADTILSPGRIPNVRWGSNRRHPADELLLITNQLDAHQLIELAEYIEGQLPPAVAMRVIA
ncbi:hypothetical protein [Lacipirellula sp.]|uniref:hypothetical protein n=1 Tax=Lacipirellula sp. TaxID=2691419 RepID=UPI003D0B296A